MTAVSSLEAGREGRLIIFCRLALPFHFTTQRNHLGLIRFLFDSRGIEILGRLVVIKEQEEGGHSLEALLIGSP